MQLTIGRQRRTCNLTVRAKAAELRRVYGLLFVVSVAAPIVWGVGSSVVRAEEHEGRTIGDFGERSVTASPARTLDAALREQGSEQAQPEEETPTAQRLTPSELYASGSKQSPGRLPYAEELRGQQARRASALTGKPLQQSKEAEQEILLLAQSKASPDKVIDLSALSPIRIVTPQIAAVGATSSALSQAAPQAASPQVAGSATPAEPVTSPYQGVLTEVGQPSSVGPSRPEPEPPASETRRRARTALHSAAANAAAAMVADSPYQNVLSGQDRFTAPGGLGDASLSPPSAGGVTAVDQGLNQVSEAVGVIPGLHIQQASVSAGYSTNAVRFQRSGSVPLGQDYDLGLSTTIGYQRSWRRSNMMVRYTPSHSSRAYYSEWNTTDHRLQLSGGRQLSRRWSVGGATNASNTGMESFWLELPVFGTIPNPPTSFDELYKMVQAGQLTDDQFASLLTGAPVVEKDGGQGLALSRVLNVSASANARYAYSPRLSFSISGSARNTQLLTDPTSGRRLVAGGFGTLQESSVTAVSAGAQYELTRRSGVSFSHSVGQNSSTVWRGTTQNSSVGYNQRVGRYWNFGVNIGLGQITNDSNYGGNYAGAGYTRTTYTANGQLSYRLRSHQFSLNGGRSVGDSFGLGAFTSLRGGAAWNWAILGSPWSANASASYMHSTNNALTGNGLEMRSFGGGIGRRVSATTAVRTSYYYGIFDSPYRGLFSNNSVHRVQASFIWRPSQPR